MNVHSLARTTPRSRALLVHRVLVQKRSVIATAEALGVSPRTVYKWLARHREAGGEGLRGRSSRPRRSRRRLEEGRVELVMRMRAWRRTSQRTARGAGR